MPFPRVRLQEIRRISIRADREDCETEMAIQVRLAVTLKVRKRQALRDIFSDRSPTFGSPSFLGRFYRALFFRPVGQQRQRIQCSSTPIDAEMKMRRAAGGVPRVANISKHSLSRHMISGGQVCSV